MVKLGDEIAKADSTGFRFTELIKQTKAVFSQFFQISGHTGLSNASS